MARTQTTQESLAELRARNELASERLRARSLRIRAKAIAKVESAVNNSGRGGLGGGGAMSQRYAAATRTRLRPGPVGRGGSNDGNLSAFTRGKLRRDCQDLESDSSIARIIIHRAQELIVGDGPVVTSTTGDKEWDARADELWNAWADATDPDLVGYPDITTKHSLAGILSGIVSAWCTDGDQAVVRTSRGSLQIIESERIITPGSPNNSSGSKVLPGGRTITDGVEADASGTPLRFHVGNWNSNGFLDSSKTRAVDVKDAMLVCNPIGAKANMTRGEPALQAVCARIERLDSYDNKVAVAAEIATLFSAIAHSKDPKGMQESWELGAADQPERDNANAPKVIDMEAGTLSFLPDTTSVTALKPEFPTTNFRDYVLWHVMIISAELGLPLCATLFDGTGLSWSNIKALLNMSLRSLEPCQALLGRVVRWVRFWKVGQWIDEGLLPARGDFNLCNVAFARAPVVDFKSEVEGYAMAIDKGLMSRDQATQALGTGTFTDICNALSHEQKQLETAGVTLIHAPGAAGPAVDKPKNGPPDPPDPKADPNADPNEDPATQLPKAKAS